MAEKRIKNTLISSHLISWLTFIIARRTKLSKINSSPGVHSYQKLLELGGVSARGFTYTDSDGDVCEVNSDIELDTAVAHMISMEVTCMRFLVVRKAPPPAPRTTSFGALATSLPVVAELVHQPMMIHLKHTCDSCEVHPIRGPRFRSQVLEDYDLCTVCFLGRPAHERERFTAVSAPHSPLPKCGRNGEKTRGPHPHLHLHERHHSPRRSCKGPPRRRRSTPPGFQKVALALGKFLSPSSITANAVEEERTMQSMLRTAIERSLLDCELTEKRKRENSFSLVLDEISSGKFGEVVTRSKICEAKKMKKGRGALLAEIIAGKQLQPNESPVVETRRYDWVWDRHIDDNDEDETEEEDFEMISDLGS